MLRKLLRNWLFKNECPEVDTRPAYEAMHGTPSIQAYRISNGYIVRVFDVDAFHSGMRVPDMTFCKDHKEVAEHIVARSAVEKLVGTQMSLPLTGGAISANKLTY
jgi:hypothetical protein